MSRSVTGAPNALYHDSDAFWLGRLAMGLAVAEKAPQTAREALEEFLRSEKPSAELAHMLREELKR